MPREYLIWRWSRNVKYAARLGEMRNLQEVGNITLGRAFGSSFPPNVEFLMNPETPRENLLTDNLKNSHSVLVLSERLKDLLEARQLKAVEYHGVTILDHKGKAVAPKYFMVHPYDDVDCLNTAASQPTYGTIRKETIYRLKRVVLDPARVDRERELFKIRDFADLVFVSRELAKAITDAKFTSVEWMEIQDYDGEA
jgi:hypothetical protein